ncbi:MAG: dipeptidase [Candidatus Hydrogenedentes bacterium]|nr:dipeptidase [Candidatus Hydrogenedentota bacterium]
MSGLDAALELVRGQRDAHLEQYKEFLRLPSISTLPQHKADVERTAAWVADELRRAGMTTVEIVPTACHPVVYAEWLGAPGKPTVLVYGHYDVQPADPLGEWVSPPFDPQVRGENIYARGASDMKGQIFAQIKAVEALMKQGPLPVNIKYMIEGEEEIGSPNLGAFIDAHRGQLTCDAVLNCDAGIHRPDVPGIIYSLRGLAYFELEVHGPKTDLHSGLFGGSIHNPAQVLCELIAGMHDEHGRVTLPGFYKNVRPLTPEERRDLARLPHSDQEWKEVAGVPALWGEHGYTTLERVGARPTLEVNGIISGFTGVGSKTVLPAKAMAKISMRLVADQDGAEVYDQLSQYLTQRAPASVTWELRELTHGKGAIMDRTTPAMKAAVAALKEVFGVDPVFKREGGSVPVVSLLQEKLGVDSVMLGFAMPDDGIHGPNEKQHLPSFYRGIETYIRFLSGLAM